MSHRFSSAAILAAALALGATASADTIKSAAGASFEITPPTGWKAQSPNPATLLAAAPSDDAGIMVFAVDEADTAKAMAGLDKLLASAATDVKWGKKKTKMSLNGLSGFSIDGSATVNGKPVLTTLVAVGGKKAGVLIFAGASKDYLAKNGAELLASFKSLKAAP
jgi:hypothetical protein